MHVRYCPACRCDYRPDIVTCADCGALLEDRDDEQDLPDAPQPEADQEQEEEAPAPIPDGFEPLLRSDYVRDLTPFADRLIEVGIECRVREARFVRHGNEYSLLVHERDRKRALEAAAPLAEGSAVTLIGAVEDGSFEPGRGYLRCPACSTELPPGAIVCPECELEIGQSGPACPGCGSVLADTSTSECPHCGRPTPGGE